MARTKFVLNERRLALLEARRIAATNQAALGDEVVEEERGSLYEALKNI